MEKRISFAEFQSVKNVARACNPLMMKRERIRSQIEKLVLEYKDYDAQIQTLEVGIKQRTGYRVEELVKKIIEPDKVTKYVPTSIVTYDDVAKQYVISCPDAPDNNNQIIETDAHNELPTTENAGSDFDVDNNEPF